MQQIKIRARIYSAFGAIVAIGLGVACFGVYQSIHVAREVDRMQALAGDLTRVLEISNCLEAIRRSETRYEASTDEAALAGLREQETRARDLLAQNIKLTLSPERRQIYGELVQSLRVHDDNLDQFTQFTRTASDARSRLFAGGDTLGLVASRLFEVANTLPGQTDAVSAANIRNAALLVQVANWRFLATSEPKGPAAFARNLDKADAALAQIGTPANPDEKALVSAVRGSLDAYASDFQAFAGAKLSSIRISDQKLQPDLLAMQSRLHETQVLLERDFAASSQTTRWLAKHTSLLQALLAAAGFALGVLLAAVIGRGIVQPMRRMTAAMTRLASGDNNVEVPARSNTDEIGDMARAVEIFKQNAITADLLSTGQAAERAAKEQRAIQLESVVHDFQGKVGGMASLLASASSEMESTAGSMSANATQTDKQAAMVAAAAEEASSGVQSVSSAADQLTASIGEIGRQVEQSARITGRAVEDARRTDEIVQALSEGARKIEDVVGLISSIAAQTNLLALNATIEAARAGDAGRGFAVVASEVKSLAQQTRTATEEIGAQIGQIQAASLDAVQAIGSIAGIVGEVSLIATAIAAAVEQQGAATAEIARNVEQTALAAGQVTRTIASVSVASNETGLAASQVFGAASRLSRQAEQLTGEVSLFVAAVRAA